MTLSSVETVVGKQILVTALGGGGAAGLAER